VWGEGVPLPTGGRVWGGGTAPPQNFFWRFWGQNGVLSWTLGAKFRFLMTKTV